MIIQRQNNSHIYNIICKIGNKLSVSLNATVKQITSLPANKKTYIQYRLNNI